MSVSDRDREDFIYFMQQQNWSEKQCRSDATIYSIETEWLKPYHTVFYVGFTENLERRKEEHTEDLYNDLGDLRTTFKKATPNDFYESLSDKRLVKLGPQACSKIRAGIIAASIYQGYPIKFSGLDTIYRNQYKEDEKTLSVLELMDIEIGCRKSQFTIEVLERERRWIFKKFQDGCNLTNPERLYTNIIRELRYRPYLNVIKASFCASDWDPIIEAYIKDKQILEELSIIENSQKLDMINSD
jgi:hypothetical protein